ncbi:unnamed protein product [Dovyalis caffra]|uniref:Prolamin-like domain-containing protein n=1 Tax=Dovyalis caffra TaxID=77055 RepID=A0AAV1SK70_9ROSI|nr:unnamed protein product [Dovyalis caffra]
MAAFKNLALSLSLTLLISSNIATASRDILINKPGNSVSSRIESEGSLVECFDALMEIKSCTNEIVLYFTNGQADDIGPDCCRAIHTITHKCWPAMFTSLGFTDEEGNILRGYCDAFPSSSTLISPASAPSPLAPVSMPMMAHPQVSTHTALATRLRLDNEESSCWESLFHLRSCISNVLLFFLNGRLISAPAAATPSTPSDTHAGLPCLALLVSQFKKVISCSATAMPLPIHLPHHQNQSFIPITLKPQLSIISN